MAPARFSTVELPPRDQFDAWLGWFHGLFDVTVADRSRGFQASTESWTLGDFGLSRVKAPELTAVRDKRLLRANPIDHWVITVGQRRTVGTAGAGMTLDVPPTIPFVASMGREVVSQRGDDERLQLYLPRDKFRDLAPLLDAAHGHALNTPLGRLLADYIALVERSLVELEIDDMPRLTGAVRAMILACVGPSPERIDVAASQINLTRKEKVRQFINKHLCDPRLDATMLCREIGMSRTQLYRLFNDDGGVVRYIRHRRLLRSYADLSDPSCSTPITRMAECLCFEDASSFSRAFKQEFGLNPREVRAAAAAGQAIRITPRNSDARQPANLRDYLLGF